VTFRVIVEHADRTTVLGMAGDLDMAAVADAESRLRQAVAGAPARLVVDLSAVTFLDSSGIRLLLQAGALARERGVELSVTRPPAGVWRLLERFRLDSRLPFVGPVPGSDGRPAPEAPPGEVRIEIEGDPQAPGRARAVADDATADLPATLRDTTLLLTSEVVTNAVRHGCSGPGDLVHLAIARHGGALRVEVRDPGTGLPGVMSGDAEDDDSLRESGWGLVMVERLASRWGIERDPSTVWFELDLDAPG
jgi:anti-anti-sigma factor